jgi:hypothetical protein
MRQLPYILTSPVIRPFSLYGWPHQAAPAALARNREGVVNFVKLLEGANEGVKAYAEIVGLKIDWDDPGSTLSPLAINYPNSASFRFRKFSLAFAVPPHWPIP